jgi:pimeloyl-ACP methyl ester carboxylesterase
MARVLRVRRRPGVAGSLVPRCASVLALALWVCACRADTSSTVPAASPDPIALARCQLASPGTSDRLAARCGHFTVPENRADPGGRVIGLRVAVVAAIDHSPAPDPLFVLAGGPGQAASEVFPAVAPALARVTQHRDVILVDQRGTGGSNALDCPVGDAEEFSTFDAGTLTAWAERCVAELAGDPRQYSTASTVEDLDAVRAALGYERINLYGGSYGTRVALAYLRAHPDRVRSAVLDGVVPPDVALGATAARDAQRALDGLLERCAAVPGCHAAFPDPRGDVDALIAGLERAPVAVDLADPRSGAATGLTLTRAMVTGALRFMSYNPLTAALIPLLVHDGIATGRLDRLGAAYLMFAHSNADALSLGLHFAVVCTEDVPYFAPGELTRLNAGTYLGNQITDSLADVCSVWPRGEVAADLREPVRSDAAVLVLSGEADPVTPPAYGESVVAALPHGRHIVAPGQGHGTLQDECIQHITADFIAAGSVAGLDASCVASMAPPPFFVNAAGPVPVPPGGGSPGGGAP